MSKHRSSKLGFLRESVSMSLSNIMHNRMRSFLTMLGIIIGVAAIIALITVVKGAQNEMLTQFEELGTGKLTVSVQGTVLKSGLTQSDLDDLLELDNVSGIAPSVRSTMTVKADSGIEEDVSISGKSATYFQHSPELVARGRALNQLDIDNDNHVCLIDSALQEKLFFGQDPLGQAVYIGARKFTIVGVVDDSADVMAQMYGKSEGALTIPYTTAMKLTGNYRTTLVDVYVEDTERTDEVVEAVESTLNRAFNYKDDSFTVINMESLLDVMNTMMDMMTSLLVGIASIALLVGGIGIMNMMLVSVTERTTEIGLRKALGAEPSQIQLQFLIESFMLSMLGGFIGMLLGVLISYVFAIAIDMEFVISWYAIWLGVGFSAAVGIIFGWAPARKASNLNPIDALRSV